MVNAILDLRENILRSLATIPCSEEELYERDFLKTTSIYGIDKQLQWLENNDKIYLKNGKWHVFTRVKNKLAP
jgi:hypothetical protein